MRKAFIEKLLKEAKKDSRIVFITADLGYGIVEQFRDELPNQFFNFGITEQSIISIAAGLAHSGYKPFVYSIGNFPTFRCLEQIRNDICYMEFDVTMVSVGAGFAYGAAGYSHYLIEDISALRTFDDLRIFSPVNSVEATKLVPNLVEMNVPKYVRLGKENGDSKSLPISIKSKYIGYEILRIGKYGNIVSLGDISTEVHKAVTLLEEDGFSPNHIAISDLSKETTFVVIDKLVPGPLLLVEEHKTSGGFGSMFLERLSERNNTMRKVNIMGIEKVEKDLVGSQAFLRQAHQIDSLSISDRFRTIVEFEDKDKIEFELR